MGELLSVGWICQIGKVISMIEIWGQSSEKKGVRLIRFERIDDFKLKWLGPVDDVDTVNQFIYSQKELEENNWIFVTRGEDT